jgi:hypothetical protein
MKPILSRLPASLRETDEIEFDREAAGTEGAPVRGSRPSSLPPRAPGGGERETAPLPRASPGFGASRLPGARRNSSSATAPASCVLWARTNGRT